MKRMAFGLALLLALCTGALAQEKAAADAVARAMAKVGSKDWTEAASAVRPAGEIGQDIVEWHRLRAADGSFEEYQDFLTRRPDWPGLPWLRKAGEKSIPRDANPNR